MPTFAASDSIEYTTHGSTFAAFINSGRGSRELCAWRLTVPPELTGTAHRPSREEVLLVLEGLLQVTIDGQRSSLGPGAVIHVPAGALLQVDTGASGGTAWVTTTRGLTATTEDGTTLRPPWAQ